MTEGCCDDWPVSGTGTILHHLTGVILKYISSKYLLQNLGLLRTQTQIIKEQRMLKLVTILCHEIRYFSFYEISLKD